MQLPEQPSPEEVEDLNLRQEFVRDALPSEWLGYAEDLGEAAEALWSVSSDGLRVEAHGPRDHLEAGAPTLAHSRSYILLAGLALENALKANLVVRDPALVNGGVLAPTLRSHKLADLADKLPTIAISPEEARILEICQEAIPYWGRYPIPLTYKGMSPQTAASSEFRDEFNRLHYRLCREVYLLIRDGWNSGVGPRAVKMRSARYGEVLDPSEPLF